MPQEEVLDVWPEHAAVWDAWLALQNRWRVVMVPRVQQGFVVGMDARLQGLDAAQIESTLRLMGMKRKERSRVNAGLMVMEKAALAAIYGGNEGA